MEHKLSLIPEDNKIAFNIQTFKMYRNKVMFILLNVNVYVCILGCRTLKGLNHYYNALNIFGNCKLKNMIFIRSYILNPINLPFHIKDRYSIWVIVLNRSCTKHSNIISAIKSIEEYLNVYNNISIDDINIICGIESPINKVVGLSMDE